MEIETIIKDEAKAFGKNIKGYDFPDITSFVEKFEEITGPYEGENLLTYLISLNDEITNLLKEHKKVCNKGDNCYFEKSHLHYQMHIAQKINTIQPRKTETKRYLFNIEGFWEYLHPTISKLAKPSFEIGNFQEAIRTTYIELIKIIKDEYKNETTKNLDGKPLMMSAFNEDGPVFLLEPKDSNFYIDVQEGYKFLFAGCVLGIRNTKAHSNENIDMINAIEKLFLASMLLKKFESRIIPN